ncbi:MAG: hypothetical protein JWO36_4471 [Myxococcales bacterium]|nr:hypothetical protein [Myxococcales bacterium]
MPVIARDTVASDHLVYAWPFPIGPEEYEVSCADDEQVVMCPAWMVGDRLGPGRHRWRTADPTRPVSAYFVLVAPVDVSFDATTSFVIPTTGQPVRLRATGSLQVRCSDPGLLVAQFVGLPFDSVNEGVLRSVTRSVERMLSRLLTRRVVMGNTPQAVTDPTMQSHIIEELVAYNPAAGAVFGVELMRMGHLSIVADDGSQPWHALQARQANGGGQRPISNPPSHPDVPLLETVRAPRPQSAPPAVPRSMGPAQTQASGEISLKSMEPTPLPPHRVITTPVPGSVPAPKRAHAIEVPQSTDDITQPGVQPTKTPSPGSIRATTSAETEESEAASSILGIGMAPIGHVSAASSNVASGEIRNKIPPGARVLVPGADGLLQSATVRQLVQGYYELEIGGSGETIWVPMNGVVPE